MTDDNSHADPGNFSRESDRRPVPDPTALTTDALHRETTRLETLMLSGFIHERELTNQSLIDLAARTSEQKRDTKDALDAALAAQKEAVKEQTLASEKSIVKSETATSERIKAVEGLLVTTSKASDDKIDDLKDRIQKLESRAIGVAEGRSDSRQASASTQALIASIVGVLLFLLAVGGFVIAVTKP